jgi:hypothetical protein
VAGGGIAVYSGRFDDDPTALTDLWTPLHERRRRLV